MIRFALCAMIPACVCGCAVEYRVDVVKLPDELVSSSKRIVDEFGGMEPTDLVTIHQISGYKSALVIWRSSEGDLVTAEGRSVKFLDHGLVDLGEPEELYTVSDPELARLYRAILTSSLVDAPAPRVGGHGGAYSWHLIGRLTNVAAVEGFQPSGARSIKAVMDMSRIIHNDIELEALFELEVQGFESNYEAIDDPSWLSSELFTLSHLAHGPGMLGILMEMLDEGAMGLQAAKASSAEER
ncbi:MAG: hypothetical protein AAGI53_14935 [Planctomycetota bacterium]